MAGLNGEYRHKLDAKGRLSLPSSIRKLLTEETQMVVVPDARNEFLSVYTNEAFDVWIDTLFEKRGGFDPNKREHMLLNSILRGNATPVTMDSAAASPCRRACASARASTRKSPWLALAATSTFGIPRVVKTCWRASILMPCSIRRSSDVEEMTNQYRHTPVLLAECLEHLNH